MKILFQSTHPVWGATWWAFSMPSSIWLFQSTHPVWGATSNQVAGYCRQEISIHAPRVGCDRVPGLGRKDGGISIHAPRVGCDFHNSPKSTSGALISIHAPRVGCDVGATQGMVSDWEFQSTHPVWGATVRFMVRTRSTMISIHAPRVGCDAVLLGHQVLMVLFQSTHPVWGATLLLCCSCPGYGRFQSTHPVWGATPGRLAFMSREAIFQSTHPVWGATVRHGSLRASRSISIHAPRVGCDHLFGGFLIKRL